MQRNKSSDGQTYFIAVMSDMASRTKEGATDAFLTVVACRGETWEPLGDDDVVCCEEIV